MPPELPKQYDPLRAQAPALSLLVIRARDVESSKRFYGTLGLDFVAERHGSGPSHYAAKVGTIVFEIYPSNSDLSAPALLRVGFNVPLLDSIMDSLRQQGAKIISAPKDSPWGRRAVVEDPDGNRVELSPMA